MIMVIGLAAHRKTPRSAAVNLETWWKTPQNTPVCEVVQYRLVSSREDDRPFETP